MKSRLFAAPAVKGLMVNINVMCIRRQGNAVYPPYIIMIRHFFHTCRTYSIIGGCNILVRRSPKALIKRFHNILQINIENIEIVFVQRLVLYLNGYCSYSSYLFTSCNMIFVLLYIEVNVHDRLVQQNHLSSAVI